MPAQKIRTIGLAEVTGAGEPSVIRILQEEDITVLDCDAVNAQLLRKQEEGCTALIQVFGTDTLDDKGSTIPQWISDLILCDPEKRRQTKGILHPLIERRIFKKLVLHAEEAIVVVEVPLLFEVHQEDVPGGVWVVACDEELLLSRLKPYHHISKEEVLCRLRHQLSQQEKVKRADVVSYNNGDLVSLKKQICDIPNMKRQSR